MDSDQKTAEIKAKNEAEMRSEMEQSLMHRKYASTVLTGTLIYGPGYKGYDRRQKYAVQVAREILAEKNQEIKKEIFEFLCPGDWAFFYSADHGWMRIFLAPIKESWVRGDR
jgi:hypothetical protein